jgi:hypothetical protein
LIRRRAKRKRLDRNRFDGLPLAKRMRVIDRAALDRARNRGGCEVPGCPHVGTVDAAHIKSKGSGGDDTDDNLVSLCRLHHTLHHDGKIQDEDLRAIVKARAQRTGGS